MWEVKITATALQCLFDIESFKTTTLGDAKSAAIFVDKLLLESITKIQENPQQYKYNVGLAEYGLSVRERIDRNNYRVLFEVNETDHIIYLLLILHTRQDIVSALYRHQILLSNS